MSAVFVRATLLAAACAFSSATPVPAFADDAPSVQPAPQSLEKLMGAMGKYFKELKKNVGKADKKDANVADFNAIALLADQCKTQVPDTAKTDDDKKLYADSLDKLAAAAKAGAAASADGKLDEAKKAFEDMKKLMGRGHKKFKAD